MRGCDCLDVFLLFFGIIFSVASGAVQPLGSVIFKGLAPFLLRILCLRNHRHFDSIRGELHKRKSGSRRIQASSPALLSTVFCDGCVSLHCRLHISKTSSKLWIILQNACLYTLCERRAAYIRKAYLRAVMRQNVAWFDENDAGALTMRMSRGVEKIKEGAGDKLVIILSSFGCFVSGIAIGFTLWYE